MPLKTQLDEHPTLNLTPMIDVLFLLIIFFMVGTQFVQRERSVKVNVPTVGSLRTLASVSDTIIVNVHGDGTIVMDDVEYPAELFPGALQTAAQQRPNLGVTVRGDASVPLQHVLTVLTACKQAGIRDVGLPVRLAPQRR
jgi:biopolymer transport protein ExbD